MTKGQRTHVRAVILETVRENVAAQYPIFKDIVLGYLALYWTELICTSKRRRYR